MGAREILARDGAIITGSHFVYAAGDHGPDYVAKDVEITHSLGYAAVSEAVAGLATGLAFEVVCGIEKGAIALGFLVAFWVSREGDLVRYVYAEKELRSLGRVKSSDNLYLTDGSVATPLDCNRGDEICAMTGRFVFGRGFPAIIKDARVLIVEDIVNTGGSVEAVIEAVRAAGGLVVGVVAICNRGGVTAKKLGVPVLRAALDAPMPKYPKNDCPLRKAGVPIRTDFGHGAAFVAEHGQPVAT